MPARRRPRKATPRGVVPPAGARHEDRPAQLSSPLRRPEDDPRYVPGTELAEDESVVTFIKRRDRPE